MKEIPRWKKRLEGQRCHATGPPKRVLRHHSIIEGMERGIRANTKTNKQNKLKRGRRSDGTQMWWWRIGTFLATPSSLVPHTFHLFCFIFPFNFSYSQHTFSSRAHTSYPLSFFLSFFILQPSFTFFFFLISTPLPHCFTFILFVSFVLSTQPSTHRWL